MTDTYAFHTTNSDAEYRKLGRFKNYLQKLCKKYEVEFSILEKGGRNENFIDLDIFTIYLLEVSYKENYPYILDFLDSMVKYHEEANRANEISEQEVLQNALKVFNNLQNSDKLKFLESVYSEGDSLIQNRVSSMGNVNFEKYKNPESSDTILNADSRWWERRMKLICEIIRFLLVPFEEMESSQNENGDEFIYD